MTTADLSTGRAALLAGDFEGGRAAYERALAAAPCGEALDGLGQCVWWLGDTATCLELRARAFTAFTEEGRPDRAAEAAINLAAHYRIAGNASLADGWLGRAERALEGCEECLARGWLEVERAKRAGDPATAARHGAAAVAVGRRIGDEGIVASGLSQQGLALVGQGEVEAGLEVLDEAILVAMGATSQDPLAISDACCTTLVASEQLADVQRGLGWAAAVSDFVERRGFLPLASWCRAVYAGYLTATGRWEEAEHELEQARRFAKVRAAHAPRATEIALADLRLRQGRVEDARALLAGLEDLPAALDPVVRLHLLDGDLELAAEKVQRRLEAAPAAGQVAALRLLRAEVALAAGDAAAAGAAADEVAEAAVALRRPDLSARAAVIAGRAAAGAADPSALEAAVRTFAELGLPLEECGARLELARALSARHPQLAVEQARAAHRVACGLGAARHADAAAALLRDLGAPPGPPPRVAAELTRREQEVLELVGAGLSNPEIADRLVLSPKTVEHHVSRVLAKLGVRNRAEAAAAHARRGG